MRKNLMTLVSLLMLASLLLSACTPTTPTVAPATTEAPTAEVTEEATAETTEEATAEATEVAPAATFKVGEVTDTGGVDDKSFNAVAWKGVQDAVEQLGIEGKYLESKQQTDYATNITQYINQKYNLIITVGFLLADDTKAFAEKYPDVNFAIVDNDSLAPNVRGLTFSTDQAGFLAGYAAAAASKTGKVATFGGINIPPVTIFMVGFEAGVKYYNEKHGTDVQVLGWESAKNDGVFAGNFNSQDDGRRIAEEFMNEGVDVIMPVAGPVGFGSLQAVKEKGNAWIIGVDTDWTVQQPDAANVILTSVLKNVDVAVLDTIKVAMDPAFAGFKGENYLGTLENGGVGLAAVADGAVSADVIAELEQVKADIIAGKINTGWSDYLKTLGN